jgi:hypothetical protein
LKENKEELKDLLEKYDANEETKTMQTMKHYREAAEYV